MTTNWMEQNKALFHALRLERLVTFITIGLIVFVAALNILISLIMMVMEKTKDIAVLMSMGTRKSQVRNIFIAQGVLIGVIGTAIGLLVRLCHLLRRRPLPHHLALARGLLHRLRPLRAAPHGRRSRSLLVAIGVSFIATLYPHGPPAEPSPRKPCATNKRCCSANQCHSERSTSEASAQSKNPYPPARRR